MKLRMPLARAFEAALGPIPPPCSVCRGMPYPASCRLSTDPICAACGGMLDENGEPIRRWPVPAGAELRVIVLANDDEEEDL